MKHTRIKWLYAALCVILCAGMVLSFWQSAFSPTEGYGFDASDEENFVMVGTEDFRALLPEGVTRIVFSDRLSPYGKAVKDFSARKCGGVVGWYEGESYVISTRTLGQKVILNPESAGLFSNLSTLGTVELSLVDTSRVGSFRNFFYNCTSLSEIDISGFDFSTERNQARAMFMNCISLVSIECGTLDASNLLDTGFMFAGTGSLSLIDLSGWDLSGVMCSTAMFQSSGAKSILLPDSLPVLGSFFFNHTTHYAEESFTLPVAAKELSGAHLFYNMGTDRLSSFAVPEGNTHFKAVDGVLYSADGTRLLALPKGKRFESGVFEIAEGVSFLGELCFSRNPYVETVLLPNSYRVSLYTKQNHTDFSDISGSGNKNVGNSLNLATYIYSGVKAFAVKDDNPFYTAINGVLYEKSEGGAPRALVAVPVGFVGTLSLPDGVEAWSKDALFEISSAEFSSLTEIRIPASLTDIAEGQIKKINALGVAVTVDEANAVYTVNEAGMLTLKQ